MSDTSTQVRVKHQQYGDSAIMLTIASDDKNLRGSATRTVRTQVIAARLAGVTDIVAGLDSVLVQYDCAQVDAVDVDAALRGVVDAALSTTAVDRPGRLFEIPTVFGGDFGPDLDGAAAELGIGPSELIARFTSAAHVVELLGSGTAPMMRAPRLGGSLARRTAPRSAVPGGAVMAAGENSIIGPAPGPSGWRILGRTPLRLFDIHRDPVVPYEPGDRFTFVALPAAEWDIHCGRALEPSEVTS
ncbi:5-oxoprolinase subunit B family protein [Rhodococcoides yunnanense]|uniref:5-oxoprolinase subunit B family protein n=1 Tax=Rhodococcoides yunnanense TaxID=278209 RepID=UPI00093309A0|nr:carboxyltransferase domain-containing protein [Rhodococcus yunnanensis]